MANSSSLHLCGILCFWIVAIVFRLLYLQLFEYGDFVKQASRQQQRSIEVARVAA